MTIKSFRSTLPLWFFTLYFFLETFSLADVAYCPSKIRNNERVFLLASSFLFLNFLLLFGIFFPAITSRNSAYLKIGKIREIGKTFCFFGEINTWSNPVSNLSTETSIFLSATAAKCDIFTTFAQVHGSKKKVLPRSNLIFKRSFPSCQR